MPSRLPDTWRSLLRAQAGVLSHDQLMVLGVTRHRIAANLDADRWIRLLPRIYSTTTGPPTLTALRWAAVLYAGPGAALAYQTAAALWSIVPNPEPTPIHVVVPYARAVVPQRGLIVHRTRRPLETVGSPPRTSAERTICDLAQQARRFGDALAPAARGIQTGRVTPDRLLAELDSRGRQRWKAHLAAAITDLATGSHSLLEVRYARDVERGHGLPSGVRQRATARTRQDVYYEGTRLVVELDGMAGHSRPDEQWRDMRRDNATVLRGETTLRFGWTDVAGNPCDVARQVAYALRTNGWPGSPRPCGPGCTVA